MRGRLGVLLLGGIVAVMGAALWRNRKRSRWAAMLDRGMGFLNPRMFRATGISIGRIAKRGRRMIRNLNWA